MPRLATQPQNATSIPLRSGFYALPFNQGQTHLFARIHSTAQFEGDVTEETVQPRDGGCQLYVTGIPLGMSEKGLKTTVGKVWDSGNKVTQVELLPSSHSASGIIGLYQKEILTAQHTPTIQGIAVSPLFDPSTSPPPPPSSSSSAILTFSKPPTFPPPSYPASTTCSIAAQASFLASSAARHSTARPHRSIVIAHVDSWMNAYDARKLASAPASYSSDALIASREAERQEALKKKGKKGKKGAKTLDVGPVPGSAAEALARHAEEQKRRNDKDHNPDEVQDGEWTLVTGGGRHGKSLLPTGAVPTVEGYGGITVKVATKKRGKKVEGEEEFNRDAGIKKIVGEGFYKFNQADSRRKNLTALKAKFEEDKARVDRLRGDSGGRGRGRGGFSRGGSSRGGGRGGGFANGGKERRAYKPY